MMKNYEDKSDFEINKAVAEALGLNVDDEQYLNFGDRDERVVLLSVTSAHDTGVDYCNNPSDAWPIITENNIGVAPSFNTAEWEGFNTFVGGRWSHRDKNPLRAAMIVFLKMQEAV